MSLIVESSDSQLTRSAQAGDVTALGLLLQRHQAGMRAVALSLLGFGPDADDAVQDASLLALRRIGDVRDPAAVGPWLRMIVRNTCRTRLRSTHPLQSIENLPLVSTDPTPEQLLDRHVLKDWIWRAIEELPAPIRMAVMLRHFSTSVTSYQEIAAACGVPVGTIRSRLSQGRAKLAEALRATADSAYGDAAALTEASRQEGLETLAEAERGRFGDVLAERWSPTVALRFGGIQPMIGYDLLLRGMEGDLEAGVHQRLRHVVASRDIVIWETDLISPADDPEHCPPAATWLMTLDGGLIREFRLYHPVA
ncbi:sigma-70 family RNA polymerase sigma factor [Streptomyces sp. SID13031]|uniref:RNA polymerase sigma factor n=1 Tax=Streptomyces sp. SID13031 TaxID=2706046 RepID=UPI0013CB06C5|nr:sigma-70 family RNA polymerase sigma factor [Streptomyces sp. SID13031]NEA37451.1 sigma-70 family RNA polymerase sigma factor [Streptomyces sp. SID13031]